MTKEHKEKKMQLLAKRILDTIISFIAIVFLVPFFLLISILVVFDSTGSAFFKQLRPGLNTKPFIIYKFRTMDQGAEKFGLNTDKCNPRITRMGRFLRRWHLDELPQLFNILKGEMSFIGPRPPLVSEVDLDNPFEIKRFLMNPGITGWAQVHGLNALSWQERVKYDVWYVEHWSIFLDFKIIFLTIKILLDGKGLYRN